MCCHYAAGQIPVNVDVLRVHHILHANHAGVSLALIDVEQGNMGMLINNAGGEMFAGTVNHLDTRGRQVVAHLSYTAISDEHIGANNSLGLVGPDGRTPNQEVLLPGQRFLAISGERIQHTCWQIRCNLCITRRTV